MNLWKALGLMYLQLYASIKQPASEDQNSGSPLTVAITESAQELSGGHFGQFMLPRTGNALFVEPTTVDRRHLEAAQISAALQFPNITTANRAVLIDQAVLTALQETGGEINLLGKQSWKVKTRSKKKLNSKSKGRNLRGASDVDDEFTSLELEQLDDNGVVVGSALLTVDAQTQHVSGVIYAYPLDGKEQAVFIIQPPLETSMEKIHTIIELDKDAQLKIAEMDKPDAVATDTQHLYETMAEDSKVSQADVQGRRLRATGKRIYKRVHAFSSKAVEQLGGIRNARMRAITQVDLINSIIARSGNLKDYVQHELVNVVQVDVNPAADLLGMASNIPKGEAHTLTLTIGAYETMGFCGRAYLFGWNKNLPKVPSTKTNMLRLMTSVVSLSCDLARFSVAHEDAHTFGAQHEPENSNREPPGWYPDAHAWKKTSSKDKFATVGSVLGYVDIRYPIISYVGTPPASISDPDFITGTPQANNVAAYIDSSQLIADMLGIPIVGAPNPPPTMTVYTAAPSTRSPTPAPFKLTNRPTTRPTPYPTKKITSAPTPLSQTPLLPLNYRAIFEYQSKDSTSLTIMLGNDRKILLKKENGLVRAYIYNMNARPNPTLLDSKNYGVNDKALQKILQPNTRYSIVVTNHNGMIEIQVAQYVGKAKKPGKFESLVVVNKPESSKDADMRIAFPGSADNIEAKSIQKMGRPKRSNKRGLASVSVEVTHNTDGAPHLEFTWQDIVAQHLNSTTLGAAMQSIYADKALVEEIKSSLDNINAFFVQVIQYYYSVTATEAYFPSIDNLLINLTQTKLGKDLLERCDLCNIATLADPTNDQALGCPIMCFFYDKELATQIFANSTNQQLEDFFARIPMNQRMYYFNLVAEDQQARINGLLKITDTDTDTDTRKPQHP